MIFNKYINKKNIILLLLNILCLLIIIILYRYFTYNLEKFTGNSNTILKSNKENEVMSTQSEDINDIAKLICLQNNDSLFFDDFTDPDIKDTSKPVIPDKMYIRPEIQYNSKDRRINNYIPPSDILPSELSSNLCLNKNEIPVISTS